MQVGGSRWGVRRRRTMRRATIAVGMAALTACGSPFAATDCTDIGGISGVIFEFNDVLDEHPREVLRARACVEDTCKSLRIDERHREHGMVVGREQVTNGTPAPVSLTISRPGGEVVYDERLIAHPVKSQPNGAKCPPTTWSAQLFASDQDNLRQADTSE